VRNKRARTSKPCVDAPVFEIDTLSNTMRKDRFTRNDVRTADSESLKKVRSGTGVLED